MNPGHQPFKWSEASLTRGIVRNFFGNAVLAIPCCGWTGHEADLLVVTRDLRLIDVEMKISRSDLLADPKKDKWWHRRPWSRRRAEPVMREWPPKIWKHYYVMPRSIWDAKLMEKLPEHSGVLLASVSRTGWMSFESVRRVKPDRGAYRLNAHEVLDLARLTGLRFNDALLKLEAFQ